MGHFDREQLNWNEQNMKDWSSFLPFFLRQHGDDPELPDISSDHNSFINMQREKNRALPARSCGWGACCSLSLFSSCCPLRLVGSSPSRFSLLIIKEEFAAQPSWMKWVLWRRLIRDSRQTSQTDSDQRDELIKPGNMALTGCTTCIKYMLFFFNFIFWVSWTYFTLTLLLVPFFRFLLTFSFLIDWFTSCVFTHLSSSWFKATVSRPVVIIMLMCLWEQSSIYRRGTALEVLARQGLKCSQPSCHLFSAWLSTSARWLCEERGGFRLGGLQSPHWDSSLVLLPLPHIRSIIKLNWLMFILISYSTQECVTSEVVMEGKLSQMCLSIGWFLVISLSLGLRRINTHKEWDWTGLRVSGGGEAVFLLSFPLFLPGHQTVLLNLDSFIYHIFHPHIQPELSWSLSCFLKKFCQ